MTIRTSDIYYYPRFGDARSHVVTEGVRSIGAMWEFNRSAVLVLGGAFLFFLLSLSTLLLMIPSQPAVARGTAITPASAVVSNSHLLEVHIANNGLTTLRNARVKEINGTTLLLSMIWGKAEYLWTVRTDASSYGTRDFGTRFLSYNGGRLSIRNIAVGDYVSVTGTLDALASEPTLNADIVRKMD